MQSLAKNFGPKSKLLSKIKLWSKVDVLCQNRKNLVRKSDFCANIGQK